MDNGELAMMMNEDPNAEAPEVRNNGLDGDDHTSDEDSGAPQYSPIKWDVGVAETNSPRAEKPQPPPSIATPVITPKDLVLRKDSSKKEPNENILPVKELNAKNLDTLKINCPQCNEIFSLSNYFVHVTTIHELYPCVYCHEVYKFPKELMVHLHREHRVPPQKFSNGKDFTNYGGENTTLLCVECNCIFELTRDMDPNIFSNHECKKTVDICSKCGLNIPTKAMREHTKICQGSMDINLNGSTTMSTTQLRNRDNSCKYCTKKFSPSKIEAHMRACSGRKGSSIFPPAPKNQSSKIVDFDLKSLNLPPTVSLSPAGYQSPSPRAKSPIQQRKSPEAQVPRLLPISARKLPPAPPQEVKLNPLLLESDPEKRLDMLILQLAEHVMKSRSRERVETEDPNDPIEKYRIALVGGVELLADNIVLNHMIDASAHDCEYCRQVKLTRIDKRQLAIHLLTKHDWKIGSVKSGQEIPTEKNIDQVRSETTDVTTDQKIKFEEDSEEKKREAEKMEVDPVPDSEEKPAIDVPKVEKMKHSVDVDPTPREDSVRSDKSDSQVALLPTPVDKDVFQLALLSKIFHSDSLIFTYQPAVKLDYGQYQCECLICGYQDTQMNIFPHWRKIHRNVSMQCVMCHGKFLFAGALYSHICLGTPQHFVTTASGGKVGTGEIKPNGMAMDGPIEGETANDTILLRYQCGICDDLQLPGFFNYMVHLRRDHNTCELCLEAFDTQVKLEQHLKKHKLSHFCWKCSVTYCAKPNFMTHLFWKHGTQSIDCCFCLKKKWPHVYHFCSPPKYFSCETCGLYFTRPKSLVVHRRLHTKQGLKACSSCERQFCSKSLLEKHIESEHNNRIKAIEFKSDSEEEVTPVEPTTEGNQSTPMDETNPSQDEIKQEQDADKMEVDEPVDVKLDFAESMQSEPLKLNLVSEEPSDRVEAPTKAENIQSTIDEQMSELATKTTVDTMDMSFEELAQLKSKYNPPEGVHPAIVTPFPRPIPAVVGPACVPDVPQKSAPERSSSKSASPKTKKKKKSKKSNKKEEEEGDGEKFRLESVQGPNLSEDESSSNEDTPPASLGEPFTPKPTISLSLSESDSDSECEIRKEIEQKEAELRKTISEAYHPDRLKEIFESETGIEHLSPQNEFVPASICDEKSNERPKPIPPVDENSSSKLDLSSTATMSLFDDGGPLSPLLNPLDYGVPEIPSFEDNFLPDHISHENAMHSMKYEHDYCMPAHHPKSIRALGGIRMFGSIPVSPPSSMEEDSDLDSPINTNDLYPSDFYSPATPLKTSPFVRIEKSKAASAAKPNAKKGLAGSLAVVKTSGTGRPPLPPLLKKVDQNSGSKRSRHSSTSSSSSSSSCSSCGSNCSCSSGSSSGSSSTSGSSSSDSDSDVPHKSGHGSKNIQPVVLPKKRQLKIKVKAPPKPKKVKPLKIKDPNIPRRPKGRPPKGSKKIKLMGQYAQPNPENGLGWREAEILKHFERPEDAFIQEGDLDTDDSGSEEAFRKQQLYEPILPMPPLIDESWTAGNETFLLKLIHGVRDVEELRPPPASPVKIPQIPQEPHYAVQPSENGESRLKLRNVPIKPLIVRRSIGNGETYTQSAPGMTIGNTTLIGKGPLKTSLSPGTNSTTITISRGVLTAATAVPASGLVKSRGRGKASKSVATSSLSSPKVNGEPISPFLPPTSTGTASTGYPSTPGSIPSSLTSESPMSITSITPTTTSSLAIAEPTSESSHVPSSTASSSPSTATPPKPRRARMKVTEIKQKKVTPVVVVEEPTEPDVKLYCICQGPHDAVSQMIGCDNDDCPYQWFHFECVGIVVAPKGKWFCQDCLDKRRKKGNQRKSGGGGARAGRGRGKPHSMANDFIGHTVS